MECTANQLGPLVEIKLLRFGISLFGHLAQDNEAQLAVRLLTLPKLPALVNRGHEVEVISITPGAAFSAVATIAGAQDDEVVLAVQERQADVQRRVAKRKAVTAPVQYRAVRTDGRMGAWLDAEILDLGTGGVGLLLDHGAEVPKRLEMMFYLPGDLASTKAGARTYADDGSVILNVSTDERCLRVIGRSAYCRAHTDGRVRVGVAFTVITTEDKQRIER